MKAQRRGTLRRPNMRSAVLLFPSGLTLINLFFGIFAIIAASRLEFRTAVLYVLVGGIFDALDGRVARATNTGTEFGEELDSLVDAVTFGLAPGMIMYFAVLNRDGWDWIFVFLFAACAVMRLARFNIEQAGTAKTYFQGLPSPAAGITLASFYWFSQSWLYSYGAIGDLPWHVLLRFIMVMLSGLMISNIPYPSFPRTGFRSVRALGATVVVIGSIVLLATRKFEYFFPISLVYVVWGLMRKIFSGLFERRQPTVPYDLSEGEDEEDEEEFEMSASQVHATRQHRDVSHAPAPARPERDRGRTERPPRLDRDARSAKPAPAARAEPTEVAERTARPGKSDRPQRTDAEREARREKREKRDKREGRPERPAPADRPERPADATGTANVVTPTDEQSPEAVLPEEVIGRIPGGAEGESVLAVGAASGRKRKRRRRRGERKERPAALLPEGAAAEVDDAGDGGSDDDGPDEDSRSPYSPPQPVEPIIPSFTEPIE